MMTIIPMDGWMGLGGDDRVWVIYNIYIYIYIYMFMQPFWPLFKFIYKMTVILTYLKIDVWGVPRGLRRCTLCSFSRGIRFWRSKCPPDRFRLIFLIYILIISYHPQHGVGGWMGQGGDDGHHLKLNKKMDSNAFLNKSIKMYIFFKYLITNSL